MSAASKFKADSLEICFAVCGGDAFFLIRVEESPSFDPGRAFAVGAFFAIDPDRLRSLWDSSTPSLGAAAFGFSLSICSLADIAVAFGFSFAGNEFFFAACAFAFADPSCTGGCDASMGFDAGLALLLDAAPSPLALPLSATVVKLCASSGFGDSFAAKCAFTGDAVWRNSSILSSTSVFGLFGCAFRIMAHASACDKSACLELSSSSCVF